MPLWKIHFTLSLRIIQSSYTWKIKKDSINFERIHLFWQLAKKFLLFNYTIIYLYAIHTYIHAPRLDNNKVYEFFHNKIYYVLRRFQTHIYVILFPFYEMDIALTLINVDKNVIYKISVWSTIVTYKYK